MARSQISLLPATRALESLRELQREYKSAYVLVDDDAPAEADSVRVSVGTGTVAHSPEKLAFLPDTIAAIAFTSGSTGKPVPSPKTWGTLSLGGVVEASRFGLAGGSPSVIVGTVPPQHMYGLETTVIMALRGGLIMHNEQPFFPADLQAVLESIDANRVLVSTPVHLRALLASDVELPPLRLTICATAPLSQDTAHQFEVRFGVEVREVYGFTEAGMVATRRTVDGPTWHLLPELKMREADGHVWISGGHVPVEAASSDVIDLIDNEHFVLRGRGADLVNIAGKRTSIGYLDHQLRALAGVEDGAFFLPDDVGDGVTRLTAFVVAPGAKREQLLAALSQRIDPVFLPRPLYLVDALPRNATGKLPRSELVKLAKLHAFERVNRSVVVDRSIDPDHPALAGHFPGDPIVPGVVLLDEIIDAVSSHFGRYSDFSGVTIHSAKFLRPVRPGECLQISLRCDENNTLRFVCDVGGVTAVSGVLARPRPVAR